MIYNTSPPSEMTLRNAATVLLIRENRQSPFEVFLMQRHRKQSFMGGAFVFPGGAQEPEDALFAREKDFNNTGLEQALTRMITGSISETTARGLFVTAIRETFEEAGVLFAEEKDNGKPSAVSSKTNTLRKQLQTGQTGLKQIAEEAGLVFKPDALIPYARWITPEIEKKRFDTWFFIAPLPENQIPVHDDIELVASMWATPEQALQKNGDGEILLMPPTLKTLEELSAFTSFDQLMAQVGDKDLSPVLPQPISSEIKSGIKLPHDPEYSIAAYRQKPRPEEPSRIMLVDGKWTTRFS